MAHFTAETNLNDVQETESLVLSVNKNDDKKNKSHEPDNEEVYIRVQLKQVL